MPLACPTTVELIRRNMANEREIDWEWRSIPQQATALTLYPSFRTWGAGPISGAWQYFGGSWGDVHLRLTIPKTVG
ncbi:hypothetical protein TNCV_3904731 [Trichonephila clavipes]|nr:hypothetical protein TNCV_3904731 [Trichonephila clavipes]